MELLREMLSIIEEQQILAEDFGNLKQINKEFLVALKREFAQYVDGKYKTFYELGSRAGQNSQSEDKPMKTARSFATEFKDDTSIIAMLVYDKKSGDQYGIIAERNPDGYVRIPNGKSHRLTRTVGVFINARTIAGAGAEVGQIKTLRDAIFEKLKCSGSSGDIVYKSFEFDEGKIYSAINEINKLVKNPNKEITVKIFRADEARKKKKQERAESKRGLIPVKLSAKDAKDFENSARSALKARLDDFKKNKLKSSGDNIPLDKFIEAVKKNGYLDKFMVDGYIYEYYNDSFNFNNIKTGRHKNTNWESDKSYVTYRIDENDEKYDKVRKEYWQKSSAIRDEHAGDREAIEDEYERLKRRLKMPPRYIKVFFDFEGGMIVPSEVKTEFNV